ncbi:MAG: amino acid adenylation domain-containing protein [Bacillota bacterium]|nr:amino acid adenylation domain-containing protein [Bacillota bacterium]
MSNIIDLENLNLLHSFFLKSSKLYPDNYALSIENNKWTYSEIEDKARCWANVLLKNTNNSLSRVGVFGNKSYTAYVGVLSSLFSGATYVPLNEKFPKERTLSMINQAELDAIIVDEQSFPILEEMISFLEKPLLILCPDTIINKSLNCNITIFDKNALENSEPLEVLPEVNEDSFAYLLFTSGSTGKPKGAPIAHKNAASFLKYNLNKYKFAPEDKFTQTFDLTFDLSVFDLFMSWGCGGCLCVMPPIQLVLSPFRFIKEHGVTVWFSVPSIISLYRKKKSLKPDCLPTLKWSLFCGEALTQSSVEAWHKAAPQSKIENLYGPTELTIACASYSWNEDSSSRECTNGLVPIGKVFNTLDSIVVDENNIPVNDGEAGELCVSGPQMFSGYLNNEEQTLKRFVEIESKKYYKTGDMVKLEKDHYIYLGRMDHQIKVQGFRIELGEIESVIRFNDNVIEAAAIPWPIVDGEAQGLVAFVSGNNINVDELMETCKAHLPYYMNPNRIYILKDVPYNSNGKIDYNALKRRLSEGC